MMSRRTTSASSFLEDAAELGRRRWPSGLASDLTSVSAAFSLAAPTRGVALALLRRSCRRRARSVADQLLDRPCRRRWSSGWKSNGSLAACSASSMIASITGCMPSWAKVTPPRTSLFGQFLDLGLDHHHRVVRCRRRPGPSGLSLHLVERRVQDVFAVDEADAGGADRAHEGHAGDGQGGRGGDHGDDVGIVLEVMAEHGADDLDFVLEALDEQRADRAVDQAGDQGLLLGRTAFALEEAARDLARGEGLLLVVHGQGEEVLAGLGALGEDDGRQHGGLAVGGQDGAVGLTGDAAGFERQRAAAPLDGLAFDVEHFGLLSQSRGRIPAGADRAVGSLSGSGILSMSTAGSSRRLVEDRGGPSRPAYRTANCSARIDPTPEAGPAKHRLGRSPEPPAAAGRRHGPSGAGPGSR